MNSTSPKNVPSRRKILAGAGALLIAAPAIVTASSIMPIYAPKPCFWRGSLFWKTGVGIEGRRWVGAYAMRPGTQEEWAVHMLSDEITPFAEKMARLGIGRAFAR